MKIQPLSLILAVGVLATAAHATTVFNFDSDNLGTSTTFTDTVNNLSATFSSSADPGGFVVYSSIFETLTGNVLGDPGPAGIDALNLDIGFSQDLSAVTLDFATADFGTPSPFTITAYENNTLVGSSTSTGQYLSGSNFPEGEISFASGTFDQLVVSSSAMDFAVDNIAVTESPEPAAIALFAIGLLALGIPGLRRKLPSAAAVALSAAAAFAQTTQSIFPLLPPSVSTVPSNGDVNPYGVAFAPSNLPAGGGLQAGDILVSNFNNSENLQGTGTTIMRIDKSGNVTTFYQGSQHGLTAAIGILSDGLVFIGNLPTADGTAATVQNGTLSVLNRSGVFLGTFGTPSTIAGPWGMAIHDVGNGVTGTAQVFVSNVLNGTISRFNMSYNAGSISASVITLATGFSHRTDPAALVLGPSGLSYNATNDTLYVASSLDNAIYEIPTATAANGTVSASLFFDDPAHLHGPLNLAILADGHFLVANSDGSNTDPNQPSELVEYSAAGQFLGQMSLDPNNGGAFGAAVNNLGWGTYRLGAVDDNSNSLKIWTSVVP